MLRAFRDTIRATGLKPPDHIITGEIIAFPGLGKRPGNTAARCFLFPDQLGGWIMDYSTGLFEVWQAKREAPYTEHERRAFKAQCEADRLEREQETIKGQQAAADKAAWIWQQAAPAASHGYLTRKRIQSYGARLYSGALIAPLYDESLALVNLQFINADGTKRFLTGGRKKACFWWIGKKSATVLIAEGFATAASLHEHTGHQVFIAFDAGNLTSVAKIVRAKNPDSEVIICGDNDESGTGQTAARAAALAIGGKYLIPDQVDADWNDILTAGASL